MTDREFYIDLIRLLSVLEAIGVINKNMPDYVSDQISDVVQKLYDRALKDGMEI